MTNRSWKPFTNTWPKYDPNEIKVSLYRSGELSINTAAFHALRSPSAIALFYDEAAGLIGISATDAAAPNAVPLHGRSRGGHHRAAAGRFLTTFGLARPTSAICFPKPTFDPDGTLVLNYRQAAAGDVNTDGDVDRKS